MTFSTPPYLSQNVSVQRVMLQVLAALLPAVAVYVWLLGPAVLVQLVVASVTALLAEAAMLKARGKPLGLFLRDGSALVTAWLIALAFPPLAPWWLIVVGVLFAIVIAKHLYGGLGQNPFNPAMIAFAVAIVSFPALMSQWPALTGPGFEDQLALILGGARELDAITGATALDSLRTGLRTAGATVESVAQGPAFGVFGSKGWEWVAAGYALGGLFLLATGIITWHMPVAFIAALGGTAGVFWLIDPTHYASPLFHLASGGAMLAAFFIVTDPVSGATTPRGKLLFAAGVGLIVWLIRNFGAYPDGIAFAVLLMNICVPLLDMKTQPRVFGHREAAGGDQ